MVSKDHKLSVRQQCGLLWNNEPVEIKEAINRATKVCAPIKQQHSMAVHQGPIAYDVWATANVDRLF